MTETTILDDSAVNEIEAMDHADMCGNALYCDCGKVIRDQLCATVKHLRAENNEYERRWRNQTQRNHTLSQSNRDLQSQLEQLRAENETLRSGIRKTLDENGHLADGENCTLIHLKRAIGEK